MRAREEGGRGVNVKILEAKEVNAGGTVKNHSSNSLFRLHDLNHMI